MRPQAPAIVTSPGRGRYRFSHALIHEAVYEELDTNSRIRFTKRSPTG